MILIGNLIGRVFKPQISVTLSHFFNWPRETSKYGGVINKKPVFLKQKLCRNTVLILWLRSLELFRKPGPEIYHLDSPILTNS